jgi:methylated-DNA-[protein]-cysteine S-methyltransferase
MKNSSTTATVRCNYTSPLGPMTLAARGNALCGIWFNGQKHQPDFSQWPIDDAHPVFAIAIEQLKAYFAGTRDTFDVALNLESGTDFQQAVWQALCSIAPGQTMSYGDICRAIGKPKAARAVGAAIGRNPISIVVPCHRVVGSNGALTGYAGGLDRKVALLELERHAHLPNAKQQ